MQYEHFAVKIPGHIVETWCIYNIVTLSGQYGSAQKFATLAGGYYPPLHGVRHRITAAKFRCVNEVLKDTLYYTVCATELPPQKFRCANEVLQDMLY